MFSEEINKVASAAEKKVKFLKESKLRYLISSAMAGMFVGFGIILIYTIGGLLTAANSPATRILMGISFGIALSLVLMAGSELFTGNNMIMTIGSLENRVSWIDTTKVWIYSFIGNLLGSVLVAWLFVQTGLAGNNPIGAFIQKTAGTKMTAPFIQLFVRGILCNILVCLAIWCFYKLKEETAKLVMVFWCLFAFITSGFEHSIANMTLLSIALFLPHEAPVTIGGFGYNLAAATLGNFVGGTLFMGAAYWYVSKQNKENAEVNKTTAA